ncbi:MAG: outer membrane protein assembly factor BamB [Rhodanobacteraceae bacterium]
MKRIFFVLLLAAVTLLAACGKDNSNIKPPHELGDFTPSVKVQRLWTAQVGRGADKAGMRMRPAFEDNTIYAASTDGYMKAIDGTTGRTLWEKTKPWRAEGDISYSGGPAVSDGVLAVGTLDGHVYTYEAKTGKRLWSTQVDSSILSTPVFSGDMLLVRTDNGKVTALKRADGSRAWVYDQSTIPTLSLRGNSNLLVSHGVVFFGSDSGKLVAIRLDTGKPIWDQELSQQQGRTEIERLDDSDGNLILDDATLYASAYHGHLLAVDAREGRSLWDHPFSSYAGVALGGSTLVGVDDQSNVWAWSTDGGGNLWKQDGLTWRWLGTPAVQGNTVVVGDREGYVHWLKLSDGSFAARTRMGRDAIRSQPLVLDDGRVIIEDASGNISAWQVGKP